MYTAKEGILAHNIFLKFHFTIMDLYCSRKISVHPYNCESKVSWWSNDYTGALGWWSAIVGNVLATVNLQTFQRKDVCYHMHSLVIQCVSYLHQMLFQRTQWSKVKFIILWIYNFVTSSKHTYKNCSLIFLFK